MKQVRPKPKKAIPFEFALDALADAAPYTKAMFGCTAVYVGEKIVLILRNRSDSPKDNGVWLATTSEHHASLEADFPSMRSIKIFGPGQTGWQVLPVDSDDFENAVLKACALILSADGRIGKVPKTGKPRVRKGRGS